MYELAQPSHHPSQQPDSSNRMMTPTPFHACRSLAVAVAVVIPHPPHNSDSSSATQPHPRVPSTPITAAQGNQRHPTGHYTDSALGLLPAQCSPSPACLAARLGDQMSLTFATHRTSFESLVMTGQEAANPLLRYAAPCLSPGMASEWRDLGIHGDSFCLGFHSPPLQ